MAVWSSLPAELALLILANLDLKDQRACLTVSSRLRTLVEPLLYRSPVLNREGNPDDDDEGEEFAQLRRFVRTIVSRPALGAHVQTLTVNCMEDGLESFGKQTSAEELNAVMTEDERTKALEEVPEEYDARSDIDMLAKAAEAWGLSASLILRGGCAGQTVLLLHHLTRLKQLVFITSDVVKSVADAAVGRLQGGVPAGLKVVEQLHMTNGGISYMEWNGGYHIDSCIPFMALPSLVDFTMNAFTGLGMEQMGSESEGDDDDEEDDDDDREEDENGDEDGLKNNKRNSDRELDTENGLPVAPNTSAVETLTFINSSVKDVLLQRIMAVPRKIKKFSYEVGESDVGESSFIPKSIVRNLLPHAQHLTHLALTEKDVPPSHIDGSVLGSLKAFKVLCSLTAPAAMLLGRPLAYSHSLASIARTNPLDAILPLSLVQMQCILSNEWSLSNFLAVTGLPHTFAKTKQQYPSLQHFTINRQPLLGWKNDSKADVRKAMNAIPGLPDLLSSHKIIVFPPFVPAMAQRLR